MANKCSSLLLGSFFILNTQKNYGKVLAFAILKCVCCVLSSKGREYSLKVCAGHKQNGAL